MSVSVNPQFVIQWQKQNFLPSSRWAPANYLPLHN